MSMSSPWEEDREALEVFAQSFDPAARLAPKRKSSIWRLGGKALLLDFATTVGHIVFIPEAWTTEQADRVIPHEVSGHVWQFRICGFGVHPMVGVPLFALAYLLLLFPIGLCYGRYRLELSAEKRAWRYQLTAGGASPTAIRTRAAAFAQTVASKAYLWPWPRKWIQWGFTRSAEKAIAKYCDHGLVQGHDG